MSVTVDVGGRGGVNQSEEEVETDEGMKHQLSSG